MEDFLEKMKESKVIVRKKFNTDEMVNQYPPKLYSPNKKIIYDIACPNGCIHKGTVDFSKWAMMEAEESYDVNSLKTKLLMTEDAFQYQSALIKNPPVVEWHVNFADECLFMGYGGQLFAQDEIQAAEHPALGSLRENLLDLEMTDSRFGPCTQDDDGNATPILIRGVERRASISVEPNPAKGIFDGIYGHKFALASENMIKKACRVIDPPTLTNLIAMVAPSEGEGEYSLEKIEQIFTTAFTAFTAAKIESILSNGENSIVKIHTGNWGTGAFGGNKILMPLLQIIAAYTAKIDIFAYHTYSRENTLNYKKAVSIYKNEIINDDKNIVLHDILHRIHKMGFQWGMSDGN